MAYLFVQEQEPEPEVTAPVDRYGWEVQARPRTSEMERERLLRDSEKEKERELKWLAMLVPEIDPLRRFRKDNFRVFERRILKGIPDAWRCRAWHVILDEMYELKGTNRATLDEYFAGELDSDLDRTIQVDIP